MVLEHMEDPSLQGTFSLSIEITDVPDVVCFEVLQASCHDVI